MIGVLVYIVYYFFAGYVQYLVLHAYVHVVFLDVGQGDANFIRFSKTQTGLIDCGKDANVLQSLSEVMRFYERDIDYLFVTHPDLDHFGGCIDVLRRFDVAHIFITAAVKPGDPQWEIFLAHVQKEHAQIHIIDHKTSLRIVDAQLEILFPDSADIFETYKDEPNNTSLVMKLMYGKHRILFTGDIEKEVESYLTQVYPEKLRADILKVGHHGSDSSSISEFLARVQPKMAIISAGKNNTFGHPSKRVLHRITMEHTQIFRTDEQGSVCMLLDLQHENVSVHPC